MKKVSLLPIFLLLNSCAVTAPVGKALMIAGDGIASVSQKPFESVVDKHPPIPFVVKVPLVVVTYPVAVGGTIVGGVMIIPGMMLCGDDL